LASEDWNKRKFPGIDPPRASAPPATAQEPEASDEELAIEKRWLLLARVDHEKFDYFYRKYYDRILRFFYQRTLDLEVAEDLTGETFERALDRLWTFRWQGVTFGGWLFRIALNLLRKHHRSRALWRYTELPENVIGEDVLVDEQADPLTRAIHSRQRRRLLQCLQELDETMREDLLMHYLDGLTYREIAVIRNVPAGTVRARVSRALGRLRTLMERAS